MDKKQNGTFIALQMKSFGPIFSYFMQGLKSAILAIFSNGPGWPCPVSAAIKNPSQELKTNIFVLGSYESLERLKGKIRDAPSFYGSIW